MDPINLSATCEMSGVGEVDEVGHGAWGKMVYKYSN